MKANYAGSNEMTGNKGTSVLAKWGCLGRIEEFKQSIPYAGAFRTTALCPFCNLPL